MTWIVQLERYRKKGDKGGEAVKKMRNVGGSKNTKKGGTKWYTSECPNDPLTLGSCWLSMSWKNFWYWWHFKWSKKPQRALLISLQQEIKRTQCCQRVKGAEKHQVCSDFKSKAQLQLKKGADEKST